MLFLFATGRNVLNSSGVSAKNSMSVKPTVPMTKTIRLQRKRVARSDMVDAAMRSHKFAKVVLNSGHNTNLEKVMTKRRLFPKSRKSGLRKHCRYFNTSLMRHLRHWA